MRQQVVDAVRWVRRQSLEGVCEVRVRIVPVEFGRLQQAHHDRGTLARELAAREQPCSASHGSGMDLAFEVVVVQRHPAITQVMRRRRPVLGAVVDGLGHCAAVGHLLPLALEPRVQLRP